VLSLASPENAIYFIATNVQSQSQGQHANNDLDGTELLALLIAGCQGILQTTITKLSIPDERKVVANQVLMRALCEVVGLASREAVVAKSVAGRQAQLHQ
jgi:hypothetical protein